MSRKIKKLTRFTTYLFFLASAFVVSSVLNILNIKKSDGEGFFSSFTPPVAPSVHADVPGCGAVDGNSAACASGADACSSGAACASADAACGAADADAADGGADAGADGADGDG